MQVPRGSSTMVEHSPHNPEVKGSSFTGTRRGKVGKNSLPREYWRGKYPCTVDLLFDWFGLVCFANKNKNFQLSYNQFQTSQTGGQRYSDTSPFSIPWFTQLWPKFPLSYSSRLDRFGIKKFLRMIWIEDNLPMTVK